MRGVFISALLAGLVSLPANAQRVTPSGHVGGFSAPRMGGGFHFASPPSFTARSYATPPQYRWGTPSRFAGGTQFRAPYGNWRNPSTANWHYGYRRPYRYRRPYVPYFYANSTYLVPGLLNYWWDWPYYDDFGPDDEAYAGAQNGNEQTAQSDYGNEGEEQRPEYNAENVPPPPPAPAASQEPLKQAALTLVFKDGHTQQVRNYAMTGTTLYVLDEVASSGRRPEIPLSSIDLPATQKANQQAGVDFSLPAN